MLNEKSHYIKYNWLSSDERLIKRCDELVYEMQSGMKRVRDNDYRSAFNAILTAFDVLGAYDGWWLRIPTNKNLYSGKTRRDATYTNEVLKCLQWLISDDYITKVDSLRAPKLKINKTYFLPYAYTVNEKLSRSRLSHSATIYRNPLADYVIVRDKVGDAKQRVPINPDEKVKYADMIQNVSALLADYDELMRSTDLSIGHQPVMSALFSMTRIFSRGTLERGGRYYSQIQNIKSEARKYITFNNEPTVEIDFSAIHPTMLYDEVGKTLSGDPYTIEGWTRKQVKVAFNIMLNRSGGKTASSAANTIAENVEIDIVDATSLERDIIDKHQDIKQFFNTDQGLRLQRADSEIITHILDQFVRKLKRPILCVHDSAVVTLRDIESLRLTMVSAYQQVMSKAAPNAYVRGFKAESLDFSDSISSYIVKSLDGSLEQYGKDFMTALLDGYTPQDCPEELYTSAYVEQTVRDV